MPVPPFSVQVDLDDLARRDLTAAMSRPAGRAVGDVPDGAVTAHHGARDERQAARQRSERDHSGRAAGAAGGRSYAFRRS